MKVSFDYDRTLSRKVVQDYARKLIFWGFEVHIVTSRSENPGELYSNEPVYEIAEILGIPKDHIHFTNGAPKADYFEENPDFLLHLDDDIKEFKPIQTRTKVTAISCWSNPNWEHKCNKLVVKVLRKTWKEDFKRYVEEGEDEQILPDFLDSEADELL